MTSAKELQKAVGKLILGRLPGTELDAANQNLLEKGIIGGAVLFKENGRDLAQLTQLCDEIRSSSCHPAIIAVDEEGGAVQRFDHILTPIPSAMALAATGDTSVISDLTTVIATELKAVGFNCLLAPVMDVLSNAVNPIVATRAFSDNPKKVGLLAELVINAISEVGLVAVGKHFPGHGSTDLDSHLDLPESKLSNTGLWHYDLMPYRHCLEKIKAIMTGHIWISSIEEAPIPASLSRKVISGILREYFNYKGVIMTDDLTMKAITDTWGLPEAAVLALEAGNDLLLVCSSPEETKEVNSYICKAVKSGRLTEQSLIDSATRLDAAFKPVTCTDEDLKSRRGDLKELLSYEKATSLKASQRAIALLRGKLPEISSGNWLVVVPNHARYPMKIVSHLRELLKKSKYAKKDKDLSLQFTEIRYSVDPSDEEIKEIATECVERNCIFLSYRALSNQGQLMLGARIGENAREKVAVCSDVPYDVLGLPSFENVLATFDPSEQAMQALAIMLLGGESFQGECPVNLEFQMATGSYRPFI
ncbi:MAG TPA: beta-N-acetylhexosaminidase [Oculatellaceae cyanobacterium]